MRGEQLSMRGEQPGWISRNIEPETIVTNPLTTRPGKINENFLTIKFSRVSGWSRSSLKQLVAANGSEYNKKRSHPFYLSLNKGYLMFLLNIYFRYLDSHKNVRIPLTSRKSSETATK